MKEDCKSRSNRRGSKGWRDRILSKGGNFLDEGKGLTTNSPECFKSERNESRGNRSGGGCVVVDLALFVK